MLNTGGAMNTDALYCHEQMSVFDTAVNTRPQQFSKRKLVFDTFVGACASPQFAPGAGNGLLFDPNKRACSDEGRGAGVQGASSNGQAPRRPFRDGGGVLCKYVWAPSFLEHRAAPLRGADSNGRGGVPTGQAVWESSWDSRGHPDTADRSYAAGLSKQTPIDTVRQRCANEGYCKTLSMSVLPADAANTGGHTVRPAADSEPQVPLRRRDVSGGMPPKDWNDRLFALETDSMWHMPPERATADGGEQQEEQQSASNESTLHFMPSFVSIPGTGGVLQVC